MSFEYIRTLPSAEHLKALMPLSAAMAAFWFTFSGLECNTQYDYSIVAQSSNGQPNSTYNGTFRTTAPTAIDNVSSSSSNNAATQTRKVFRNGQVLIQHNGKTYTISGNEVK